MSYKRLIDIYSSSSKTIDALMKLELPSGGWSRDQSLSLLKSKRALCLSGNFFLDLCKYFFTFTKWIINDVFYFY
jgi:hypothetical protein